MGGPGRAYHHRCLFYPWWYVRRLGLVGYRNSDVRYPGRYCRSLATAEGYRCPLVKKLIGVALIILTALVVIWKLENSYDADLDAAVLETSRVQAELSVAQAYSSTVDEELKDAKAQALKDIKAADTANSWLKQQIRDTTQDLQEQIIKTQVLLDQINAPVLPDMTMAETVVAGADLYPGRDLSAISISGNDQGKELFLVMIEEIKNRRQLDLQNAGIIQNYENQFYRLEMVIGNHENKFLAVQGMNNSLTNSNEALRNQLNMTDKLNATLENQITVYKKKNKINIKTKVIEAGITIGIYEIFKAVFR